MPRRIVLMLATIGVALLLAGGAALAAIIDGTDAPETIQGTANGDIIDGLGGNDKISGLAGGDTLFGGTGNDRVFGGDALQSFANDGGSNIRGGIGDDLLVGSSGADTIYGGPGADTIMEGPGDDSAGENIRGEDGDDFISVASIPASEDAIVDCGAGVDEVEADPLDNIPANCENVTIVRPTGNETDWSADGIPEPSDKTELPEDAAPPEDEITTQAQGYREWTCNLRPAYRGATKCGRLNELQHSEWVQIGVYWAAGYCKDLNFWGYAGSLYLGFAQIGECIDKADYIYGGGKSWLYSRTFQAYGKSAGNRWTYAHGYVS